MSDAADLPVLPAGFAPLVAAAETHPILLAKLAQTLLTKNHPEAATALAFRVINENPANREACLLAREVLAPRVPAWHFSIVRDEVRNAAYDAALRRAVKPGMRVLDIGSGTGLLAMMAARAGAAHVYTCEMNPVVADAAERIVRQNGFAGRITVLRKHSEAVNAVQDLGGGPVDLLVSEIVSNDLISEDPLPAMEQAVRWLLKPGGVMIPAAGSVWVALAQWPGAEKTHMPAVHGFDLSGFNALGATHVSVKPNAPELRLVSSAAPLLHFDFASGGPFPEARVEMPVVADGSAANGIVQWMSLKLDGETHYDNRPGTKDYSCWAPQFYPFAVERLSAEGEPVTIRGSHDRHTLRLWVD